MKRKPVRSCSCPWQTHVPSGIPGKTKVKTFEAAGLQEARTERMRLRSEPVKGGSVGDGTVTLGDFFENAYLVKKPLAPASIKNYRRWFADSMAASLGHLKLDEVTTEHIQSWVMDLSRVAEQRRRSKKRRNPTYVLDRFVLLRAIFNAAVRWGRIDESPARHVELPHVDPLRIGEEDEEVSARKVLEPAQVELLLETARTRSRGKLRERDVLLFSLAYQLGLRSGEIRALRWSDFDFAARRVTIERQYDQVVHRVAATKGRNRRTLPVSQTLIDLLVAYREHAPNPAGYIFANTTGGVLGYGVPNYAIGMAQKRAGLVDPSGQPLITFHGLRHTCASILLNRGTPVWMVSRFLGHSSVVVTEKTYAHLLGGELDRMSDTFDQLEAEFDRTDLASQRVGDRAANAISTAEMASQSGFVPLINQKIAF